MKLTSLLDETIKKLEAPAEDTKKNKSILDELFKKYESEEKTRPGTNMFRFSK